MFFCGSVFAWVCVCGDYVLLRFFCFCVFCVSSWRDILAVIDLFAASGSLTAAQQLFVLVLLGSGGQKHVAGGF